MKRIGIKYCGGCNPTYDRVKRVERLKGTLKGSIQFVSYQEAPFDLLLIINGCPKACADREDVQILCPNRLVIEEDEEELQQRFLTMIKEDEQWCEQKRTISRA